MKQQISHLQAQMLQKFTPTKDHPSPRKTRIELNQPQNHYNAQNRKPSIPSQWSPVLNESNNDSRNVSRTTTPNSQIHMIALGSIQKKMSSSHIEDVLQRAQTRLTTKEQQTSDLVDKFMGASDYEERGAILQSGQKLKSDKSQPSRESPKKSTSMFKKQYNLLESNKIQELYYTPQGGPLLPPQLLSARFHEATGSSDCIFKSDNKHSSLKGKNSERSNKQIYSSNDPNKQHDSIEAEGKQGLPSVSSQVKRKPLQGFLSQLGTSQQDRSKMRSSQQYNILPSQQLIDLKVSLQKASIDNVQTTMQLYNETLPIQKLAPQFLVSPRKTTLTNKPQTRLTLQHTRTQSITTAYTALGNNKILPPTNQDLMKAINKTTLTIDPYLQAMTPIAKKQVRNKSKKPKTQQPTLIDKESSSMFTNMFKTSAPIENTTGTTFTEAPSIIFKNTVNQPKFINQTAFQTTSYNKTPYENKKVKTPLLPATQMQRETSRQRPATTQAISAVVRKTKIEQPVNTKENGWGLSDSECQIYGDRCPKGYVKIGFLGKGGIAVVWLCLNEKQQKVAVKQFPKKQTRNVDNSAKVEIKIYQQLYSGNAQHVGLNNIARLYTVVEDVKDSWLVYEVGKQALGSMMFDVKGEFFRGERIYNVVHKEFYAVMMQDLGVLKDFLRLMAQVLDSLQEKRVVHADLKPDNILIEITGHRITSLKLIDFGSSFSFEETTTITATTPEYLAPEVLQFLESRNVSTSTTPNQTSLFKQQKPWSYDMWSLGAILLEILSGIPIWMSLKCRTIPQSGGKQTITTGIFGVQGRSNQKILLKVQLLLRNLPKNLQKFESYGLSEDLKFVDLLVKILHPEPQKRMSPKELLEHPFLQ